MQIERAGMKLKEVRVELVKYEGDAPRPGEVKEPIERKVLVNGVVVEHTLKGVSQMEGGK